VLFTETPRGGLKVVARCQAAARRGVQPGMTVAEAKGLAGGGSSRRSTAMQFLQHDPEADSAALNALAVWCGRFSPLVAAAPPDNLLLDLSGCAQLSGSEPLLLEGVARALLRWSLAVRAAIASNIGAAWALAHFAGQPLTAAENSQEQQALRPLPVQALRLPPLITDTLAELNVRTVEQLQSLPRKSLPSRFGAEIIRRLDQATGKLAEVIAPVKPPAPVEAHRSFEHPVSNQQAIQRVLEQLTCQVTAAAAAIQKGVQQLEVTLFDTAGRRTFFTAGTLHPSQSAAHLNVLIKTRLEYLSLTEEVARVQMLAITVELQQPPQEQLFDTGEQSTGRELSQLLDRISNRLGKQRVVRPRLHPDAQPERSIRWEPVAGSGQNTQPQAFLFLDNRLMLWRPLCLRAEPAPVQVRTSAESGPPLGFTWNATTYNIARYWGPERIETGWWRGRFRRRDYYRVETPRGQRFWIFQRISQRDWFLHGEF